MTSLFFIDANIPIYAAGREHPLKEPCFDVLRLVFEHPNRFITNAEVLQELLHHYRSLRLLASGPEVVQSFSELMRGRVEPVIHEDVDEALEFAIRHECLSARDALHLAVMKRLGSDQIVTTDRAFSEIPDVTRLDPAAVEEWGRDLN